MTGLPVTVRLLDPPLHEFVPHFEREQKELAADLNDSTMKRSRTRSNRWPRRTRCSAHRAVPSGNHLSLRDHRDAGSRRFSQAAPNTRKNTGIDVHVEITAPLVVRRVSNSATRKKSSRTPPRPYSPNATTGSIHMIGTMIEVPRAAVTANEIAEEAEFFSFGTHDLDPAVRSASRATDVAKFLPVLSRKGHPETPPVPGTRPGRRGSARARGRIQGPRRAARTQSAASAASTAANRARSSSATMPDWTRLLLSVPRADTPASRSTRMPR